MIPKGQVFSLMQHFHQVKGGQRGTHTRTRSPTQLLALSEGRRQKLMRRLFAIQDRS